LSQFILHSGTGIGGDFEYHFSPRLGLNFSLDWAELDVTGQYDSSFVWEMGDEQMSYLSFTVGPNFHLTPGSRADFYLGLFVGYASLGRVTANLPSAGPTLDLGDSFVYGGLLGLDIGLGVRQVWALHLGIRQEILEADGIDVDPFLFEAGVARRF
jgi:outer membrane protein W